MIRLEKTLSRCWDNFWSSLNDEIKDKNLVDIHDFKSGWMKVKNWLESLESKYKNIKFLTDNASFDTASIDYALEKYCDRMPMRYSSKNEYRSVISADDMFDMLPIDKQKQAYEEIKQKVKHDHDPINDSHYIYLLYIYAQKMKF